VLLSPDASRTCNPRSFLARTLHTHPTRPDSAPGKVCVHPEIGPMFEMNGIVHRIDPVARELQMFANGTLVTFDVPMDCRILLHGERVKLRLLQTGDQVQIRYVRSADFLAARSVEVS